MRDDDDYYYYLILFVLLLLLWICNLYTNSVCFHLSTHHCRCVLWVYCWRLLMWLGLLIDNVEKLSLRRRSNGMRCIAGYRHGHHQKWKLFIFFVCVVVVMMMMMMVMVMKALRLCCWWYWLWFVSCRRCRRRVIEWDKWWRDVEINRFQCVATCDVCHVYSMGASSFPVSPFPLYWWYNLETKHTQWCCLHQIESAVWKALFWDCLKRLFCYVLSLRLPMMNWREGRILLSDSLFQTGCLMEYHPRYLGWC